MSEPDKKAVKVGVKVGGGRATAWVSLERGHNRVGFRGSDWIS
jgi:hypothetical protein